MKNQHQQITEFWEWFSQTEAQFRSFFGDDFRGDKKMLIHTMDNWVLSFGKFAWEIGPGEHQPFHFILSPNGDAEHLNLSKQIMSYAPDLPHWDFYFAKPIKTNALQFQIYNSVLELQEIDAQDWKVALLSSYGNKFELIIEAKNLLSFDTDTRYTAGHQVILNLLGEDQKIQYIDSIRMVEEIPSTEQDKTFPLFALRKMLHSLLED